MKYHIAAAISMLFVSAGCFPTNKPTSVAPLDPKLYGKLAPMGAPGQKEARAGDEIVVCGQLFHTGTPVVTWMDPGGFDGYRTERRFAPWEKSTFSATTREVKDIDNPARFGIRFAPAARPSEAKKSTTAPATVEAKSVAPTMLTPDELEMVRGGGWTLPLLQQKVDQFVLHFDVTGTSRQCFNILHDHRDLSVTFMCDIDGTIYQTLDCKEKAFQATKANSRSIGIEIANIGAYSPTEKDKTLEQWYRKDANGKTRIVLPAWMKASWVRTPGFIGYPIRNEPVTGEIQGHQYQMYDLTPQQYEALEHLTATLCTVFPKIKCDYPKDEHSKLITHVLSDEQYENYEGVMGHYHVQSNKQDPGPALQWDRIIDNARAMMKK